MGVEARDSNPKNFFEVRTDLHTSGQPSESELVVLAKRGVRLIVNLGLSAAEYALEDEGRSVLALGLEYEHIPVEFTAPKREEFERFVEVLDRNQGRSMLVHCALNYRASCFVALYAERRFGWSEGEGEALLTRFWEPNETWREFAKSVRAQTESRKIARK